MPMKQVTKIFINKLIYCPPTTSTPPPPPIDHQLIIVGSFEQTSCMVAGSFTGTLTVGTVVNTGNDTIVLYKWTIDGYTFTTVRPVFVPLFTYNVEHHVSVEALAGDGHTAFTAFPPIKEEGNGTPLPPLGD